MTTNVRDVLEFLSRFDRMAVALSTGRRKGKSPFSIDDEYDVQDLVFAALKPLVRDLTTENPYPKVAGVSGRVDLTSRSLGLVVEIKAALREGREKDIARECMERIKLYSGAPEIRFLVFFLYDPHGRLDLDAIQMDLEGPQHRQDRSGNFEIVVVGPKLALPRLIASPAEEPANATLTVDDAKPVYSSLGVIIGCTLTLGAGCSASQPVLRVGGTRIIPALPPDCLKEDVTPMPHEWPLEGPCRKDLVLYFGVGGDGRGEPTKYGSSGILEILDGSRVVARDVVDLPEPQPQPISDADAENKLSAWFLALPDEDLRSAVIFAEVDTRLLLPAGTARRLLAKAVAEHFDVKQQGPETVRFEAKSLAISDVGRGRGWSPSQDGFGGF